ncbi:MAG: two-component sensor histidine kinase [Clostridia bacterium]|nr:two-component sensor histidine kinase [Clostridia bacterium]
MKHTKQNKIIYSSLRAKLLGAFALFIAIAIVFLWLFQTFLMDSVYHSVKSRELLECAQALEKSSALGTETLGQTAAEMTKRFNICISVYAIEDGYGREIIREHTNTFCFVHNMTAESSLNRLYREVLTSGESYTEEFSLATLLNRPGEVDEDMMDRSRNMIYANVLQNAESDEGELFLILNTEIAPLASTISTLRLQLIYICIILAVVAAVMAVIISYHFTKPLRSMSTEATKLAMGNYDVQFNGGTCKETVLLSDTLNHAAYELSRLDKMRKDLIANISHDLRTPLTMISGYSEVIRDLPGEATPENMQIIIDETRRLTSLVNDMLEVSQYQSGNQVIHPTLFNLTDVVRQSIARYAKLREKEGYRLILEADGDVYVHADETRILQVLYNLINNAVNYTGEDKTVIIRQTMEEKEVVLSVIDSGIGIPEEQLPMVWERYYKVHDFHKRANMGTGLGLSIVKNILVLHNARFGVQSKVGSGSRFWFALPAAEPPADDTESSGECCDS